MGSSTQPHGKENLFLENKYLPNFIHSLSFILSSARKWKRTIMSSFSIFLRMTIQSHKESELIESRIVNFRKRVNQINNVWIWPFRNLERLDLIIISQAIPFMVCKCYFKILRYFFTIAVLDSSNSFFFHVVERKKKWNYWFCVDVKL